MFSPLLISAFVSLRRIASSVSLFRVSKLLRIVGKASLLCLATNHCSTLAPSSFRYYNCRDIA